LTPHWWVLLLQGLTVLWLVGSFALVWGVMLTIGGFDVRRLHKQLAA